VAVSALKVVVGSGALPIAEAVGYALGRRADVDVIGVDVNVQGVVDKVRALRPAVVVVSADSSAWDGIGACAAVKELDCGTRVVVIGPGNEPETLRAVVKAGADGFVMDTEPLEELVDAILQVSRGQSRIPPSMLGVLLRGLIEFRRSDDAVVERFASLGRREREVLAELVSGESDQVIASKLFMSPHTARTHVQNILIKLGVHSRVEAARMIIEHDLFARFGIDLAETQARQETQARKVRGGL